jgi:hypothetical protein
MRTTHCRSCNLPLVNRRPQTKTCNSTCRSKVWRHSRISILPVPVMLSFANHAFFTKAANDVGVSINSYIHDRLIKTIEYSQ